MSGTRLDKAAREAAIEAAFEAVRPLEGVEVEFRAAVEMAAVNVSGRMEGVIRSAMEELLREAAAEAGKERRWDWLNAEIAEWLLSWAGLGEEK